jgi:hypothetical protein
MLGAKEVKRVGVNDENLILIEGTAISKPVRKLMEINWQIKDLSQPTTSGDCAARFLGSERRRPEPFAMIASGCSARRTKPEIQLKADRGR